MDSRFAILARYPSYTNFESQLDLNILEMWGAVLFQTLRRKVLPQWLPPSIYKYDFRSLVPTFRYHRASQYEQFKTARIPQDQAYLSRSRALQTGKRRTQEYKI